MLYLAEHILLYMIYDRDNNDIIYAHTISRNAIFK